MEHRKQKLSSPKGFVPVFEMRGSRPVLFLLVLVLVGLNGLGGLPTCRRKTVSGRLHMEIIKSNI